MTRTQQTFIGSSSEGLPVAQAIVANLPSELQCRIWSEDLFLPGRTFIESLEKVLDEMDYAILVATPDDRLIKRDVSGLSMRDNVLLELGLFMAKLGRVRTYLVSPKDTPLLIPSDLLGITTVTYVTPNDATGWTPALAEPCRIITKAMKEAETELSRGMKRVVVKRLLGWTTKVQGLIVALQAESFKSVLDRTRFDRIRGEMAKRLSGMVQEYEQDATSIGVVDQYGNLAQAVLGAVDAFPFPEEALVSRGDLVGGALGHFLGGNSIEKQFSARVDSLSRRYDAWWHEHGSKVSQCLLDLQAALVVAL
jgi:hypothetical protein